MFVIPFIFPADILAGFARAFLLERYAVCGAERPIGFGDTFDPVTFSVVYIGSDFVVRVPLD